MSLRCQPGGLYFLQCGKTGQKDIELGAYDDQNFTQMLIRLSTIHCFHDFLFRSFNEFLWNAFAFIQENQASPFIKNEQFMKLKWSWTSSKKTHWLIKSLFFPKKTDLFNSWEQWSREVTLLNWVRAFEKPPLISSWWVIKNLDRKTTWISKNWDLSFSQDLKRLRLEFSIDIWTPPSPIRHPHCWKSWICKASASDGFTSQMLQHEKSMK